jgi:hypothetical protein
MNTPEKYSVVYYVQPIGKNKQCWTCAPPNSLWRRKELIKEHIPKVFNFTAHELHCCNSTYHYNMAE